MFKELKNTCKLWWLILIIGILCVLCGAALFVSPIAGIFTLALILTINLIASGILGIIFVIANRKDIPAWVWNLILPVLTLIAGIVLLFYPAVTTVIAVVIFSFGVLFRAIENIIYAFSMTKVKGSGWGWKLAAGIILFLLAILLFVHPVFAGLTLGLMVAFTLLFMGIEAIIASIGLSKMNSMIKRQERENSK